MAAPKFTKLELHIIQTLWDRGTASIRQIQEAFRERDTTDRPIPLYRPPSIVWSKERGAPFQEDQQRSYFEAVVSRNAAQR